MSLPRYISCALTAAALGWPAQAAIVSAGNGSQNITAPANDFGFASVGMVFDTQDGFYISGVHLRDGWVLTAYHGVRTADKVGFQFGTVFFNNTPYTVDPTTAVRLTTPSTQGVSDLALFRLMENPNLPAVAITATTPLTTAVLSMAGNGRNRAATETHWNVNTAANPDVWTETVNTGDRQGYFFAPGQSVRWGNNRRISGSTGLVNDGYGVTQMYRTQFDNDVTAVANEAQAAPGDSGGGVFIQIGLNWELAGIMLATTPPLEGQPPDSVLFGDQTFIGDLSAYRTQIMNVIPEPSAALLVLGAGFVFGGRRRRGMRG